MKIEVRETKEPGIVQITTLDERWYRRESDKRDFASITWIGGYAPKGYGFYKWLASKGWDEAEAVKIAGGDKGSKVHQAIEQLTLGNTVSYDDRFPRSSDGEQEELTVEEWEAVLSFEAWWTETNPKLIKGEQVVYDERLGIAGTLDLYVEIDGKYWIIDIKTSKEIYLEHEIQIAAYRYCLSDSVDHLGIIQVGYNKNKRGWKLTEVEDKFDVFLAAYKFWAQENSGLKPKQKDYPKSITLRR